jgi:hypothetical protein
MVRTSTDTLCVSGALLLIATLCSCGSSGSAVASGGASGEAGQVGQAGSSVSNGGSVSSGGTSSNGGASAASGGGAGAAPGSLNPTDCATPGGTPLGKASGTPGVWEDVSPKELSFDPTLFSNDNFGAQDMLVDPVRPSDLYTFVCHQGVWKSTDYGSTWTKVNTGNNGSVIDSGKPWGSGIDSNRCRDPNTPPALYTLNGNGQLGFWKSTDGGVSWVRTQLPDQASLQYSQDAYSINVDPYDGHHILMGFHEASGLLESHDGGATWLPHKPADDGISVYYTFIDTGVAATTGSTWLSLGQSGNMYRTTDSGTTWTQVETLTHAHGCSQLFQAGAGVIYAPGIGGTQGNGVYRSADFGATWSKVVDGNTNNVIGTDTTLYENYAWADSGGVVPEEKTAPRNPGTQWTSMQTPAAMTNGAKGSAVTFDGTHYMVVSGNWNAGLWRFIEP